MGQPKRGSKLSLTHDEACDVARQLLKGTPLINKAGDPVYDEAGKMIMMPPSAAAFREVREFLKDHGIDEEATDESKIVQVAKAIKRYEDFEDSFLVPDAHQPSTKSTS